MGVDIASKRDIHDILIRLARTGASVVVVSDDLAEVLAISHRVLVMRGGRIVAELSPSDITEDELSAHVSSDGSGA
ncbi:MAG: hypothetical protein JNL61_12100 [Rhizobiaceae bacterium]|nr:hypothetical protein [Rhizobiaceae bacterium]